MLRVTRSTIIDAPIADVWAVLRDFNSHTAWHAVVAESTIENGEPSDQIGCVRNFTLADGNHIREQLIALSDKDYISTYCILDATLPMERYVATVRLSPVTDGNRTFWHWQSTFDAPRGREQEFADLVGKGVYEAGFDGLRRYLLEGKRADATRANTNAASPGNAVKSQSQSTFSAGSLPCNAVFVERYGGPEVLSYRPAHAPAPAAGEVRIRQTAIGVNYIDVYVRKGLYPLVTPPGVPGMEGAGQVVDIGPGVAHLLPGDRVAYAAPQPGAYATIRTLDANQVVRLPSTVSDITAAAVMLKGMTAEYLLTRTTRIRAGDTVLVHAAAGGAGLLLCQWAAHLGATVIGTVSSDEKARLAREHGCAHPIVLSRTGREFDAYRFAHEVMAVTHGRGVDAIYDGLGQAAMEENLASLALTGHWVSYGQASGALPAIPVERLNAKSATLSHPVLFHYTADAARLRTMAANLFEMLERGMLTVHIGQRFPLSAAAEAHRALEARGTTGCTVLLP